MKWFGGNSSHRITVQGLQGKTINVGDHKLKVEEHLGDGGFAVIYRVRDVDSNRSYALKHIVIRTAEARAALKEEAKLMKKVAGHPHILSLLYVAFGPEKNEEQDAYMLMDLCSESLYGYLQRKNFSLADGEILDIFWAVCKAVEHLHMQKHPILHRDIKIENVLKHPNGNWILCDFGSARSKNKLQVTPQNVQIEQQELDKTTTPAYRAPEMWDIMMGHAIDERADVWALGCTLYLLCYGTLPFTGESQLEVMAGKSSFPQTRTVAFANVIAALLQVEPQRRPNIQTVLAMIEDIRQHLKGGKSKTVSSERLEPRSASVTLKSDHVVVPKAVHTSLSTAGSMPSNVVLNETAMPNSARRASVDVKPTSVRQEGLGTPPQKGITSTAGLKMSAQSSKTLNEDNERPRPLSMSVPKLPISPALAGNNKTSDNTPFIMEEIKSLKSEVGHLRDQNQMLYGKILQLETTVASQQRIIRELIDQPTEPDQTASNTDRPSWHPQSDPAPIGMSLSPRRPPVSPRRDAPVPPILHRPSPPSQSLSQVAVTSDHRAPVDVAVERHETATKTPSGRFGGTFWKSIANNQQLQEETSSESTTEIENRHKRVVSDPPPLESWHASGKL